MVHLPAGVSPTYQYHPFSTQLFGESKTFRNLLIVTNLEVSATYPAPSPAHSGGMRTHLYNHDNLQIYRMCMTPHDSSFFVLQIVIQQIVIQPYLRHVVSFSTHLPAGVWHKQQFDIPVSLFSLHTQKFYQERLSIVLPVGTNRPLPNPLSYQKIGGYPQFFYILSWFTCLLLLDVVSGTDG
jgi:hypothetical protein